MASVFFYISGHGFGHASRQIEVINALAPLAPGHDIVVRTSAARWLFDSSIRAPFTWLPGECDTGIVQIDSLRLDVEASIRRADRFHEGLPGHVEREAALLREHAASLVIGDAPPLACAAAAAAGIPSLVVANFTWDWIYDAYPQTRDLAPRLIPTIQDAYRHASAACRLPMHGGFSALHSIVDVPFIARHARQDRGTVRQRLSLPAERPLALSSFGGYGLEDFDPHQLDCLGRWGIVITGHQHPGALPSCVYFINERAIYDAGLRYEDLVHSVDVVVTKPGFGIIAECLANGTAMLYTSRGHFAEYDVMVAEMPRLLRCEYIDRDALMSGRWLRPLDRVLALPPPPDTAATNGADVVAQMIRERL